MLQSLHPSFKQKCFAVRNSLAGSCWNRRTVSTCWTVWRMTVFPENKKETVQNDSVISRHWFLYNNNVYTQWRNANNNNNNKGEASIYNIYEKCSALQMCASDLNSIHNSGVTVMKVKDEFEIRNSVGLRLVKDKMVFGSSYCSSC